jgi:hypothetical protein
MQCNCLYFSKVKKYLTEKGEQEEEEEGKNGLSFQYN